jgi:hypothetical protein
MAFRQIIPGQPEVHPQLVEKLAEELRLKRSTGPDDAPSIIERIDRYGGLKHVTVIWDAWKDLDTQTRSRIILDAYEKVEGPTGVLKITLALGLTRGEGETLRGLGGFANA